MVQQSDHIYLKDPAAADSELKTNRDSQGDTANGLWETAPDDFAQEIKGPSRGKNAGRNREERAESSTGVGVVEDMEPREVYN